MTDIELVDAVAKEIKDDNWNRLYDGSSWQVLIGGYWVLWRPLESWDHAMMVRREMQAKGFEYTLADDAGVTTVVVHDTNNDYAETKACADMDDETAQRRAVLQATLKAVEEKP